MSLKPEPKIEKRSLTSPVSQRDDNGKATVAGYAAVFGDTADIGDYFREVIAPGAFAKTVKGADVRAYFDHDRGRILGRSTAGTLRLAEDAKGLAVEIDLPDTSDGRDVQVSIQRGDIDGMSFGFMVLRETWDQTTSPPTRTIHELDLREVSIVSEPAYDGTSIALRSLEAAKNEARQHPAHQRIEARRAQMEQRFRRIE